MNVNSIPMTMNGTIPNGSNKLNANLNEKPIHDHFASSVCILEKSSQTNTIASD